MIKNGDKMVKIEKIGVTKQGNSHYWRIPADYIQHGQIDPSKTYDLEVTEASQ